MFLVALQPAFHMFNQMVPSIAIYLSISALLTALPAKSKAKGHPAMADFKRATSGRVQNYASRTYAYSIPTSMRPRR